MPQVKVLAMLLASLGVFSSPVLARKPAIREHYFGSWYLKHTIPHELIFNENFNRHRDFGYVACYYDRRSHYCNVTLVRANSTESCRAFDDVTPHVDHASTLLVPDDVRERDRVAILWSSKRKDEQKIRVSYVNMTDCRRDDTDWMPVKDLASFSRLLQYPYPAFAATFVNDTNQTGLLAFSLDDEKPTAEVLLSLNYSYYNVFKEAPNYVDSHVGLFFIHANRTDTSVMYANLTSVTARKIGDAHEYFQEISGSHDKYGVCWRKYRRFNCTQYDVHGHDILNGSTVKLTGEFDWWKVHNLEGPAMLLITGRYSRGKFVKFNVTKIQAAGQMKSSSAEIDGLSVDCPRKSDLLKVAVSEDLDGKLICVNFVFATNKYNGHDIVHLQYRRICIDQDYVNEIL